MGERRDPEPERLFALCPLRCRRGPSHIVPARPLGAPNLAFLLRSRPANRRRPPCARPRMRTRHRPRTRRSTVPGTRVEGNGALDTPWRTGLCGCDVVGAWRGRGGLESEKGVEGDCCRGGQEAVEQ